MERIRHRFGRGRPSPLGQTGRTRLSLRRRAFALTAALALLLGAPGVYALAASHRAAHRPVGGPVLAVGAENEYANVISQIGGPYVRVHAIMSNPNTDPHTFEASTVDARLVASATLVVQNGVGYDSFMNRLESASPNPHRIVITAAKVMGVPATAPNPHLFYEPGEMERVAARIAAALGRLEPAHKAYFAARVRAFGRSLLPWTHAIALMKRAFRGAPVAVTEPVADFMLQSAGLRIRTPWAFQAAIMNSTDPSPQDVGIEETLLLHHEVRVFVYNQQAVDSTTTMLLDLARRQHVPVVGVYETMPPGHNYQSWMLDETMAVYRALRSHQSSLTMR